MDNPSQSPRDPLFASLAAAAGTIRGRQVKSVLAYTKVSDVQCIGMFRMSFGYTLASFTYGDTPVVGWYQYKAEAMNAWPSFKKEYTT